MTEFAKQLKLLREAQELSQQDFAKRMNVSAQYQCDLEQGRRMPSVKYVETLCREHGRGPDGCAYWHTLGARAHGWLIAPPVTPEQRAECPACAEYQHLDHAETCPEHDPTLAHLRPAPQGECDHVPVAVGGVKGMRERGHDRTFCRKCSHVLHLTLDNRLIAPNVSAHEQESFAVGEAAHDDVRCADASPGQRPSETGNAPGGNFPVSNDDADKEQENGPSDKDRLDTDDRFRGRATAVAGIRALEPLAAPSDGYAELVREAYGDTMDTDRPHTLAFIHRLAAAIENLQRENESLFQHNLWLDKEWATAQATIARLEKEKAKAEHHELEYRQIHIEERKRLDAAQAQVARLEKEKADAYENGRESAFEEIGNYYLIRKDCQNALTAAQQRVARLTEALEEVDEIILRLERDYAIEHTLYDGRPVEAWCAKKRAALLEGAAE